jgi:hypothetical protein
MIEKATPTSTDAERYATAKAELEAQGPHTAAGRLQLVRLLWL